MRILIFSWRDIKHPSAGGAEILTMELAKRWVKSGHLVTLLSANFPKGRVKEIINGVQIRRLGHFYHYSPREYLGYIYKTFSFYRQKQAGNYDLILDQVHGLPFFTPFYAKENVILFPLEVAGKIWFQEVPFPYSLIGFGLEQLYIQFFKKLPFLTISPSTAKELRDLGVKKIFTIQPGLNFRPSLKVPPKNPTPLLVSLGRITEMKRIDKTLQAFRLLHKEIPFIELVIIGRGKSEHLAQLRKFCYEIGIEDRVFFPGFIKKSEKIKILKKAWLLVSSSMKEGWGLTVTEAAACGTPTVAYKIPGLVDSIKDRRTGLLCQKNTPVDLARNIRKILLNDHLRQQLSQNALTYSRQFTWNRAAKEALTIFDDLLKNR